MVFIEHLLCICSFTSMQLFCQAGPVVEAENRTITKAGKDLLSRAGVPMGEADEKHKYVMDSDISNIKNNQAG